MQGYMQPTVRLKEREREWKGEEKRGNKKESAYHNAVSQTLDPITVGYILFRYHTDLHWHSILQCVAVCRSVLQSVFCSVLSYSDSKRIYAECLRSTKGTEERGNEREKVRRRE